MAILSTAAHRGHISPSCLPWCNVCMEQWLRVLRRFQRKPCRCTQDGHRCCFSLLQEPCLTAAATAAAGVLHKICILL